MRFRLFPAILTAAGLSALVAGGFAVAQRVQAPQVVAIACAFNTVPPTLTSTWFGLAQCDADGKLITSGGGGGGAVTIADGADVAQGAVADAAATAGGTGTLSAKLRLATTQLDTINTTLGTNGVLVKSSSAAAAATTAASSTAAANNLVLKASAGNLYDLTVTIGATSGYLMLFDATSLPSDGAVTPVHCYPVTSNGTNGGVSLSWPTPKRFATGITAGFSTTGCFTLTASATANFFGGYQ